MFKELQSQAFMRNPAPVVAELRAQAPIVRVKVPIIGKVWITTTQKATSEILKAGDKFTVRKANNKVVGLQWWMPKTLHRLTKNMLATDEPEHTRLRGIVDQAFHRREVLALESSIADLATGFAVDLFHQRASADLVGSFARKLPLAAICELLGLPKDDWPKFTKWAAGITTASGILSFIMAINKLKPLTRYIEERIALERQQEGGGLLNELVHLEDGESKLSDDELVAMVFLLLLAGHETTTHLISGGVLALLENPDQLEKLKSDWSLLDLAVEECLRFVSPVQFTKPRYVRENCKIQGVELKSGDLVLPMLLAANYDPALFDRPEVFDITRKPNRHIEFGSGVHFCLGHQLARLEMRVALKTLFEKYPDLELSVPADEIRWNQRFGLRALESLQVKPV